MRTKRWMGAFVGIAALVGVAGCGDDVAPSVCSAATCNGCCQDGQCQPGTLDTACGLGGVACTLCGQGKKCETGGVCKAPNICTQGCLDAKGVCQPGNQETACGAGGKACVACHAGETCQADGTCKTSGTCAHGCLDAQQICQPGNQNAACGIGGAACVACKADETCTGGTCSKACNATTCADGCCASDGTCVKPPSGTQCGVLGAACVACKASETCTSGTCADPLKTCAKCPGCCASDQGKEFCLPGNTLAACGVGGAACSTCKAGEHCDKGACVTVTKKCDKTTCPAGCCLPDETCVPFGAQTNGSCGKGGEACNVCKASTVCQQGTCVGNQPCFSYCKQGCCTAKGQCLDFPKQDATKCGTSGVSCSACGKDLSCAQGACIKDAVWEVSAISAVIAPKDGDGKAWDTTLFTDPLPDPYIRIKLTGAFLFHVSKTIDNTLTPNWSEALATYAQSELLNKGLTVSVLDSDGVLGSPFETIGTCTVTLTLTDLTAGKKTIATCDLASQVILGFTKK